MNPTILRTNASAVYGLLTILHSSLEPGETLQGQTILDCGAGGPVPPLAIFAEQGMVATGIDISEEQLGRAREFVEESGLSIQLQQADMRELPFTDDSFDVVYEHFSMCHLSKADTAIAIAEMRRVLKPGGIAFLGVVSADCWPLSSYGEERTPGERWMVEGGHEVCHAFFADQEADLLVSTWDVAFKQKSSIYFRSNDVTPDDWFALYPEAPQPCSEAEWAAKYVDRGNYYRYVHAYYFLEKPSAGTNQD